ncbi:MAG: Blue-light-activated protein [Gemmataceae bacterium]|nr:Blue-light-activated protein [Gemmataceae bacterium]
MTDAVAELAQTLFEEIGDAAFIADPETMLLLDVNPMAQRLTGLPREELLQVSLGRLFRSDEDEGLTHLQRALSTTQTFHSQEGYLLRRGPGAAWIPVNLTLTRLHTERRPLGMVLARDVTERVRAEERLRLANAELERRVRERTADLARVNEALRAEVAAHEKAAEALRDNERRLRAFFETSNAGMGEATAAGGIVHVNDAFCRMVGHSRGELLGMNVTDLTFPEDRPRALAAWREIEAAGTDLLQTELRYRRKDGSALWALLHLVVLSRDAAGRPATCSAVIIDQTQRRRAVGLMRSVLDSVNDAIITVDERGGVQSVNPAAERVFGYAVGEGVGCDVTALLSEPDRSGHGRDTACFRPGAEANGIGRECRLRRKDGSPFPGEVAVTDFRLDDGRYYTVVVRDLTERKRLEDQLRQAQKMEAVGQLAGGVAHDFNNLLTVINGYSELLMAEFPPSDRRRESVTAIREAGERAAGLTGQLLAFSRKAIVEPKVLDLNEVIDSTGKMLRRLIGEDITLTTVLSPALSRVRIDPGQVEQVIMNLAVNARDAMPRGGRLSIETADAEVRPGDPDLPPTLHVRLAVSDTGCGMTDDVKAHIFEPFFTTKGPGSGTGLGLATVYGIVKQAGGHITAESQAGSGTTFTILLPAVPEAAGPAGSGEIRLASRGTETVLLAEDEDGVRGLSRLALEMQGYTVLESGTGTDALRAAAAHPGPIHLLVTDVVMPDLGGRELADAVRARRPGVKVLYMSGYTDDAIVRRGVSRGIEAFLQKPFTPLGLARKVREVLDGAS